MGHPNKISLLWEQHWKISHLQSFS